VEAVPLGHALGAEIRGIDIAGPLTDNDIAEIRDIWQRHHAVVFREIDWSPDQHLEFSRRFGALDDHAATPHDRLEGYPELLEITNRLKDGQPSQTRNAGRNWHADYSYTGRPAATSMLYCTEKPTVGGDTMFCNMAAPMTSCPKR